MPSPCVHLFLGGHILHTAALNRTGARNFALTAERYPILTSLRGKPTEIIVDNAAEFRSLTMEAAARHAGFSVRFCPIKQPRYRAMCERVIGTINRQLCEGLPGRTLSLQDARRWGYNAEEHAVVMLDELEAFMNHLVAVYNVEPHDGIGKRQPALVFEKDLDRFGINNFADFESFRRDTMQIQENAQLSPSGIRAFGSLRYHDAHEVLELLNDLVPLEPRRRSRDDATATVDFRFDPMNISRIYVWNRKTRRYVELRCSDERYADGMPLWLHDRIREVAKAEGEAFNTEDERLEARGRLVQAVRAINPGDLAASRKRMAELLDVPRIRQITGNIVHLLDAESVSVSRDDFIANDRAALTSLDHEILAPRPAPRTKTPTRNSRRRYEDAREAQEDADVVPKRDRGPVRKGGYK